MADENLVLYVASYPTTQAAEADYADMKGAEQEFKLRFIVDD